MGPCPGAISAAPPRCGQAVRAGVPTPTPAGNNGGGGKHCGDGSRWQELSLTLHRSQASHPDHTPHLASGHMESIRNTETTAASSRPLPLQRWGLRCLQVCCESERRPWSEEGKLARPCRKAESRPLPEAAAMPASSPSENDGGS